MTMEKWRDLPRDLVEEEIVTRVPATHLKDWDLLVNYGTVCLTVTGDSLKHSDEAAKQFMVLLLRRTLRISPAIVDLDGKAESFTVTASCYAPPPTNLDSWFGTHLLARPGGSYPAIVRKERHFALGYYKEGNNKRFDFSTEKCVPVPLPYQHWRPPKLVSWSKVLAFDMSPGLQLAYEARFLLDDEKKVVMLALN
ncbi:unnamed protein product [Microthlaspi erraticum]|uniref:Uncharacterized protein n=1 Tax=Microthlaspi erraticum TaxID=1685480 RepID=A0A6D2K9B1_9BRAS|nr:unnamed protein product [Microthlaspi erraticum]